MIAYHYPPARISSGIQRTLKFSTYLHEFGWKPAVLSVNPRAYSRTSDHQVNEIPRDIQVKRAFALDTQRHLAIKGHYPLWLALPDSWSSWWIGGVWSGLALIRKFRPDIIWSTFPIPTAHMIGLTLHRLTGIPWVADCRDSMTEDEYPAPGTRRNVYQWLERSTVTNADKIVFTTPGAIRMYADRYPDIQPSKWAVIPNGFDEENFQSAESENILRSANSKIILLHSGLLYPHERDPRAFFAALAELKQEGAVSANSLCVKLRATGFNSTIQPLIDNESVADIVTLESRVEYRQALSEMLSADGLLLFQASSCNHQIPAKLYEYLRAGRPVLALTDPAGDTAAELRKAGIDTISPLDDKDSIKSMIRTFLDLVSEGSAPVPEKDHVDRYSRRTRTAELADLFEGLINCRKSRPTK